MKAGARIKFLTDLGQGPTGDTPAFVFAKRGDGGWIATGEKREFEGKEAYSVFWDHWKSAPFLACVDEFELIEESA